MYNVKMWKAWKTKLKKWKLEILVYVLRVFIQGWRGNSFSGSKLKAKALVQHQKMGLYIKMKCLRYVHNGFMVFILSWSFWLIIQLQITASWDKSFGMFYFTYFPCMPPKLMLLKAFPCSSLILLSPLAQLPPAPVPDVVWEDCQDSLLILTATPWKKTLSFYRWEN